MCGSLSACHDFTRRRRRDLQMLAGLTLEALFHEFFILEGLIASSPCDDICKSADGYNSREGKKKIGSKHSHLIRSFTKNINSLLTYCL